MPARFFRVVTAVVMLFAVLVVSACGSGGKSTAGRSNATITFWHYFTDRAALMQQLAAEYKQQTGVTVKLELIPGDTLGQKFQAAAQARRLPDLAAAWGGIGDALAPYAKTGTIMNLSGPFAGGWSDRFYPSQLQAVSFLAGNKFGVAPGPYLIPLDANNMQILYNRDLFAKAGITQPPATFDELLADGNALAAKGIAPFTSGFSGFGLDDFAQVYEFNMIGKDALEKTFAGKLSYDSAPWRNFLGLFERIGHSRLLAQGILAADMPAAENLFVNGKAAMIFDGSWAIGVFRQANPAFTNYGVAFPPAVTGASYPVSIPGGVGAQLLVVGTSPHKQEALAFAKWLTDPAQQERYAESSSNLPANKDVRISASPLLDAFASKMPQVFPALADSMEPAVATTLHAGLQDILAGKSTAAQVAAAMQKARQTGKAQ